MRVKGWAVKTADGEILIRTVSPTPRGAQVNWLYTSAAVVPTNAWSDDRINKTFSAESLLRSVTLVKVEIVEDLTT